MKYLGYIPLIASFVIGYMNWPAALIVICAFISVFIFLRARREQVKHKDYSGDRNMLVDGAYLFAVQTLIMFTAYLLGGLIGSQYSYILQFLHLA